jgi:tripartite-type tricarboxylate transporter receptor subunit TctC
MIKRMKSRHFAAGLGCVLTLAAGIAMAQEYPTKSVRLVVPASPGGGLDIMARAVALELTPMWAQSVVVDNRPGAGVFLGTEMVAKAPADGYTLLMINSNLAPNLVLLNRLDVGKQLTGVAKIADLPTALAVNMSLPAKSVKDLIALAKTSKLAYSTTGNGTTSNIAGEMLKLAAKVDITHVPYKGGNPAMAAVISGEVGMGFASLASVRVYEKAGRVRVLAVASTKRSALAPDVPTLNETFPGVIVETWVGMVAPTGVPRPILHKINADVVKVVKLPEISKRLLDQGYDLQPGSPETMDKLVQSDLVKYAKVIREAKIRGD